MLKVYEDARGRFRILVDQAALLQMVQYSAQAGARETGGILIGSHQVSTGAAVITEATLGPQDSEAGPTTFRRGVKGLRALLQQRWRHGDHYLGEWHFHPGGSAQPSFCDNRAMARIARSTRYVCREPILVVIGGRPQDHWDISVSVFPANEKSVRCEAVSEIP